MGRAAVTVVVPCRDRPDQLSRCLDALRADLGPADVVVVVDSASRGPRVAEVARAAGARVVRCDRPGVSRARNAGWRAATTEVVAFVDDDMAVAPGWLDALLTGLAGSDRVGFAVGRVVADESSGHGAAGLTSTVTSVEPPPVITVGTGGVVSGGNLAVPRPVLDRVGGFDERIGPGTWFANGEEIELLDRILATGRTGRYVATAVTRHEQWRDRRELLWAQWAYGKGTGARIAVALRRNPRFGVGLLPELVRIGGVRTALSRRTHPRTLNTEPDTAGAACPDRGSKFAAGWAGPVLWRLGALWGFAAGVLVLRPQRTDSAITS